MFTQFFETFLQGCYAKGQDLEWCVRRPRVGLGEWWGWSPTGAASSPSILWILPHGCRAQNPMPTPRFAWKGKYNPKYKCLNLNQNESGVGQMSMSAVCQLQLKAPDLLFEPTSKWSAGPRLKRRRDITKVQNVLPDEASVEPDLTWSMPLVHHVVSICQSFSNHRTQALIWLVVSVTSSA